MKPRTIVGGLVALAVLGAACSDGNDVVDEALPFDDYQIERVFVDADVEFPTFLTSAGDGSGRLFLMSQLGKIVVFTPDGAEARDHDVYLDLSDRIVSSSEQGMLGLAFDPDFSNNGYFYVHYSVDSPRRGVISRFAVDPNDPSRADKNSELMLMEIPQPYVNHNGGMLAFGPDGYLYIGLGDGGSGGDPLQNAQDPETLHGSVLRVDVRGATAQTPYTIPEDNPFASVQGGRPEVWAYGLRNPWRFSFDRVTGDLWLADVGQNAWEEINLIVRGGNYGWNIMEASRCYPLNNLACDTSGLIAPIVDYTHAHGCSVTGGYVYRGSLVPELTGMYLYGDYCTGKLWGFAFEDSKVARHALLAETGLALGSFGEDENGEVYLLDHRESGIYRITPR